MSKTNVRLMAGATAAGNHDEALVIESESERFSSRILSRLSLVLLVSEFVVTDMGVRTFKAWESQSVPILRSISIELRSRVASCLSLPSTL